MDVPGFLAHADAAGLCFPCEQDNRDRPCLALRSIHRGVRPDDRQPLLHPAHGGLGRPGGRTALGPHPPPLGQFRPQRSQVDLGRGGRRGAARRPRQPAPTRDERRDDGRDRKPARHPPRRPCRTGGRQRPGSARHRSPAHPLRPLLPPRPRARHGPGHPVPPSHPGPEIRPLRRPPDHDGRRHRAADRGFRRRRGARPALRLRLRGHQALPRLPRP